jgi:tetratricopeptide (TPR) repeat protein
MIRTVALFLILCMLSAGALAQSTPNIRTPVIDTESAEGALIAQAGTSEDPAQKIQFLETFVGKFPSHEAIGYVYLQLHELYLGQQDYAKSAEYGKKAVEIAPNDIELRDSMVKARRARSNGMRCSRTPPRPRQPRIRPRPLRRSSRRVSSRASRTRSTCRRIKSPTRPPRSSVSKRCGNIFPRANTPSFQGEPLATAYQQAGEYEKMLEAMREHLTHDASNEVFLYTLADAHARKNELDPAKQYADQLIQLMAQKEKPEGVDDAAWDQQKTLFTALGNFVLGRILVTQEKYREGRALLLQTVDPLKAQGGDAYGTLAYFLGICYVKLDIQGDNIVAARNWITVASNTPSAYQAEAKTILSKLPRVERR